MFSNIINVSLYIEIYKSVYNIEKYKMEVHKWKTVLYVILYYTYITILENVK